MTYPHPPGYPHYPQSPPRRPGGLPPYGSYPPPPPPKTSRKGLWIGLSLGAVVVLLLSLTGFLVLNNLSNSSSGTNTAQPKAPSRDLPTGMRRH
jgi:hypothetical protein